MFLAVPHTSPPLCLTPPLLLSLCRTPAGPWWLLADDPSAMYRLWSTPVHRWLVSSIYKPVLAAGRPTMSRSDSINYSTSTRKMAIFPSIATGSIDNGRERRDRRYFVNEEMDCIEEPDKSVRDLQGGGTIAVLLDENTNDLQQQPHFKQKKRPQEQRLRAQFCVFAFSSVAHETALLLAMRRSCWPFSTFLLFSTMITIVSWESMFPLRALISKDGTMSPPPILAGATPITALRISSPVRGVFEKNEATAVKHGETSGTIAGVDIVTPVVHGVVGEEAEGCISKNIGSEWRGWKALFFFYSLAVLMTAAFDFIAWQWWRQTLLI